MGQARGALNKGEIERDAARLPYESVRVEKGECQPPRRGGDCRRATRSHTHTHTHTLRRTPIVCGPVRARARRQLSAAAGRLTSHRSSRLSTGSSHAHAVARRSARRVYARFTQPVSTIAANAHRATAPLPRSTRPYTRRRFLSLRPLARAIANSIPELDPFGG